MYLNFYFRSSLSDLGRSHIKGTVASSCTYPEAVVGTGVGEVDNELKRLVIERLQGQ